MPAWARLSVPERFSWAAERDTKRKEDKAYCHLGIFDTIMPLIYSEEYDHAYRRLRRAIEKSTDDTARYDHALSMLPVASEAAYTSRRNQFEPFCLPSTRVELLRSITNWGNGSGDSSIYWLNGIAGAGKSTVARTIASSFDDSDQLAASFFFSKGGGNSGNANKLITTLAWQLSSTLPSVKSHMCEAILEQRDILDLSIRHQWKQLIMKPLSKLRRDTLPNTVVMVIDALDECDSQRDIDVIIRVLGTAASLDNVRLRILLTSRPEIHIRSGFKHLPDSGRKVFVLHEISPALVDHDLGVFFEDNFRIIREEREYEDDWPSEQTIKRLMEISCGLFNWASTACRFIREGKRAMRKRIDTLLSGNRADEGPEAQLDQIYTTVIKASVDSLNQNEKKEVHPILSMVLGSIVAMSSPLSMKSLAALLRLELGEVQDTLADLRTIFYIPQVSSSPVRLHHPSFRDFLLDPKRSATLEFQVDREKTHRILASDCVKLMSKRLKQHICGLQSPGTLIEDVDLGLIQKTIPPELQYACVHWVEHIRQGQLTLVDDDLFHRFLQEHYLHWLEAMYVMGRSAEIGAIIRLYHSLLEPSDDLRQMTFVKDAKRLNFAFQSTIKLATLQIYCAALASIPPTNELQLHFRSQLHPWIKDVRIAEAIMPKPKDEFNYVNDIAFTPDGKSIASGSQLLSARLWDVATRTPLRRFGVFEDKVSSVAISPNGAMLACGSDDFTVRVWDLRNGSVLYSLKAHSRWVNSVVFSRNSKLLATGSMDETIAIWEARTGRELKRYSNQGSCVNCATMSPDCALIATASVDHMIRLWDIMNDSQDAKAMLDGHSGCVNSVCFAPNGQRIVSGSDDMSVRIWDVDTATELLNIKGHTKRVMAAVYFPDARSVISGSEDKTVRICDATRGNLLHLIEGHPSGLYAVVFSPDGKILATGLFNDDVRLYETKTWKILGALDDFPESEEPESVLDERLSIPASGDMMERINEEPDTVAEKELQGHSSKITSVAFAARGNILATASQDTTIKLWSREGPELFKLEGHAKSVNCIVISPDGSKIASSSLDATVRLWDTATGVLLYTFGKHSGNVHLVYFSSDGQLLASCSTDRSIGLWKTSSGNLESMLEGHIDTVNDISFSPDNHAIASCSVDTTSRLWDLVTKRKYATLRGHTGAVNTIAYSSDGEMLVSCSDDSTIRLWTKDGFSCGIIRSDAPQINCVTFSPDSTLLVSSSMDGNIIVWDRQSESEKGSLATGVPIRKASFSKCGWYVETDRGSIDVQSLTFPPLQLHQTRPHALFVAKEWLKRDLEDAIWLPDEYHATSLAISGDLVVMGHTTGKVSFVYIQCRQRNVKVCIHIAP